MKSQNNDVSFLLFIDLLFICTDYFKEILPASYSSKGTVEQKKEENTYMNFIHYLDGSLIDSHTKSCVLHTTCTLPWPAGVVRTKNKIQQKTKQNNLTYIYMA